MPASSRAADKLRQRRGGHHGAGWIGGRGQDDAFELSRAMQREQGLAGERPPRRRGRLDADGLAPERGEDVPIGWIAGQRHGHAVAGLERRQESQHEAGRGAGGNDDAGRIEIEAVPFAVGAGDAPPQRGDSKRFRIAERARGERGARRGDCRCRRGGRRLADFHVDDAPALRLKPRCRRDHVHHHERRHGAARRRLQQEFRPLEHQFALTIRIIDRRRPGTAAFAGFRDGGGFRCCVAPAEC